MFNISKCLQMWTPVILFDALQSNKTSKLELSANNGITTLKEALSNANQYKGKCFLLKCLPRPLLIWSWRACHELWALLLQLCPAEYTLWDLVHLFADDKIILRTCMHMHRKARVGFLILREDVFQKTSPDQICTHYFISVQPLLRA